MAFHIVFSEIAILYVVSINFNLYLFYNNYTLLQVSHTLILLVENETFGKENYWDFFPRYQTTYPTHAGCGIRTHVLKVTRWC